MATPCDNGELAAVDKDANPFSFQRFVSTRSESASECAPDNREGSIAFGQNVCQNRRECLIVVGDKPKAQIERPKSLKIIAYPSSVPVRHSSLCDDTDGNYSSSSNQVNVPESVWLQEPVDTSSKAQNHIDKNVMERLEEKNKKLHSELEDAQETNKELLKRLNSLGEQLVEQQAREHEETAALERMVQRVECSLKAALERASSAEEAANILKQEVKTLQTRCKQLEMQQQNLSQMTSVLSSKLRAAADSAEGSLRSLLEGVNHLRLYSDVVESWTKVHEDSS